MDEINKEKLMTRFPEHEYMFFNSPKDITQYAVKNMDILIVYGDGLSSEMLLGSKKLKWIHIISSGLELIPFDILIQMDVIVTNVKGIHSIPIAEYTIGMILNMVHRNYYFYDLQLKGEWESWVTVEESYGKTIGIIGLGAVGTEIAKRAKAFGMKVLGISRSGNNLSPYVDEIVMKENKDYLLKKADFVVLTLPYTNDTDKLIGKKELSIMKNTAYLINISRGKVVDEDELIGSLKRKDIQGAILDVFTNEPLSKESRLWNLDNVIITPHASGRSPHYMERSIEIFCNNLDNYGNLHKMVNVINLKQGY